MRSGLLVQRIIFSRLGRLGMNCYFGRQGNSATSVDERSCLGGDEGKGGGSVRVCE